MRATPRSATAQASAAATAPVSTSTRRTPDTGAFHGDLLAALRGWIRSVIKTPAGRMLAGLVAEAQRDPALAAAWRERVFEPLRASNTVLVQRAIDRGEIPASTDADIVLDLVFGAACHRLLQGHRPLSDLFARRVVDLIVAGVTTQSPQRPLTRPIAP